MTSTTDGMTGSADGMTPADFIALILPRVTDSHMDDEQKKKSSAMASYAIYSTVGIQLAAAVVAGFIFGNYLDEKFNTSPWIAVSGITLGFVGGIMNLFRIMKWFNKGS